MFNELGGRIKESLFSILPIVCVLLFLHFSGVFMFDGDPTRNVFSAGFYSSSYPVSLVGPFLVCFLISVIPMIIGSSLFGMGADQAMTRMGTLMGSSLTKKRSTVLLGLVTGMMGGILTFAEPDITFFSTQLMGDQGKYVMIIVIALGVGLLLGIGFVRIMKQWSYKFVMVCLWFVAFGLASIADHEFLPIAFDGAGSTIGSLSAPFIVAMGIGVASVKGSKNAEDDSFGISGLAGLGPLVTVLLIDIISKKTIDEQVRLSPSEAFLSLTNNSYAGLADVYESNFLSAVQDVAISISPILVFFFVYDIFWLKISKKELLSIIIGLVYTCFGLTLFLTAVNSGFIPVGWKMGVNFSSYQGSSFGMVIAVMALIGFVIILAEPSVHVLGKQIEEVSRGAIRSRSLFVALCFALMSACILGVLRAKFPEINYAMIQVTLFFLSLVLSFFVPTIYFALSFDSAGVASGTMASAFLLPICSGLANALYDYDPDAGISNNSIQGGFGVIGLVSTCSIIAIQVLGAYGEIKRRIMVRNATSKIFTSDDSQVIHLKNGEPGSI